MNAAKYLLFHLAAVQNPKTSVWDVTTLAGHVLGQIRWYGSWRRYAFFPGQGTLFEEQCLRDLADFIDHATRERRLKHDPR